MSMVSMVLGRSSRLPGCNLAYKRLSELPTQRIPVRLTPVHTSLSVRRLRERWREGQRIDDGVPSIIVSEFYKAGKALVRFNHPFRNCGNR
jgi:hypothetical protein